MNLFSIPPILSSIMFLLLGGFVYLKNRRSKINIAFFFVCLTTFWWQFSWFFLFNIEDGTLAKIFVKIGHVGIVLLPVAFLHFSLVFLGKTDKLNKIILTIAYTITAFFEISLFTTNYFVNGYYEYYWGFYPKAGFLHPFFLLFVGFTVIRFVSLLFSSIKKELKSSFKYFQIEYVLVAMIFYILASVDFAVNYGFEFYPIGFIFILIFLGIVGYAISKYQLMNIKVILTEFLITVIALVLLIQFILSETIFEYIWEGILLLAFLFFGYLLIKSVLNEIKLREKLEIANNAKSEFVSIASHQLRTPLTAVKGYISMMIEGTYGKLSQELIRPLQNVYESNERLTKLVNDLLDLSRLEAGKIEFSPQLTSLEKIVFDITEELKINADKKGLYLKLIKPAKALPEIMVDQPKIRQVILNIIDNAIKYTRDGGITIELRKTDSQEQIIIADTGIGVSQDEIKSLFQMFSRASAGAKLHTDGSGVGLHVAKKFIEMHHGRIWVESEGKDKGSTFYIELPIRHGSGQAIK